MEGKLALESLLRSPYPLLSVLVLRRRLSTLDDVTLPPGVPLYVAEEEVMSGVAGFNVHRGLLAVARRLPPTSSSDLLGAPDLRSSSSKVSTTRKTWAPFSATPLPSGRERSWSTQPARTLFTAGP